VGLVRFYFRDDDVLDQHNVTHDVIERLHGGSDERSIFDHATAEHRAPASVQRPMLVGHRGGNDRTVHLDDDSDGSVFEYATRR